MVKFIQEGHLYKSVEPDEISWISVTTLLEHFKEKFDSHYQAIKSSKNSKSKWYQIPPLEIEQLWLNENKRSTELGSWWHQKRENRILSTRGDAKGCTVIGGVKIAGNQKLTDGIYPESLLYLQSVGLCGQSDEVEILGNTLNVTDAKTNKDIRRKSYVNWEGISKKLLKPLHHLEDCEYVLYSLQLSLYAHILLRHNPNLTLGKLTIEHVKFKEIGRDKYDYPILLIENGEPVIDTIEYIECKYMRKEVQTLIEWLKNPDNRNSIIKH